MKESMTSTQRVATALEYKEPDRVPFFLPVTMSGARELQMSTKEYYSRPENVAEAQLRILTKYKHDFLTNFYYGAIEAEAWGGEVVYVEDGPVVPAKPVILNPEDINKINPPKVKESDCLLKVLRTTEIMRDKVKGEVPVIGTVIAPLSLPTMQMWFDAFFDILYEKPDLLSRLLKFNEEFCIEWANAQLDAGADLIIYFDPVASTTVLPKEIYFKTGFEAAKSTIARIKGPTWTLTGSGRCLPIVDALIDTATKVIWVGDLEDIGRIKADSKEKLAVAGNLNSIEMRRWTPEHAESQVKEAIAKAGPGGGYILSDSHGEISWQVPDEILMAISDAVYRWGRYPLSWIDGYKS